MADQPRRLGEVMSHENLYPAPASSRERGQPRTSPQRIARLILAAALVLIGLWTLRGFLSALGWAIILTIATWPLYDRFALLIGRGRKILAPTLFTLLIGLVFMMPLALAGVEVGRELNGIVRWLGEVERSGVPVPEWLSRVPWVGSQAVTWWQTNLTEPGALTDLVGRADTGQWAKWTQEAGILIVRRLSLLLFTMLTLFFLFRDGVALSERARVLICRIFGRSGERLAFLMVSAVRSTADGLVLVGLGEGAVIGISYVAAGVPHPALLATLTGVLAIIPFGAPLIFCLASLFLFAQGSLAGAIGVLVCGTLVVFVADHVIRPVLIGGGAKLPFLWVLLGIFGGLATFGLLGLFVGPALMAALMSLWREWTDPSLRKPNPARIEN